MDILRDIPIVIHGRIFFLPPKGHLCGVALEKIAFAMQLMQRNRLNHRYEFQVLFSKPERGLILHSGLLQKDGDSWHFSHNNFREYLTAQYLSKLPKDQVISFISTGYGIRPSWVNTLGFLTGIELEWNLTEWIAAHAPNALIKYEPDQLDFATRYQVFQEVFCYYESKQIWLNDDLFNFEQLAHFSQSNTTLTFLLERIKNPVHDMSLHAAINILRHYSSLFGRQNEIRSCLLDCCAKYPSIRGNVCRIAIFSIKQLNLHTPKITETLVTLFYSCDNDYVRLGMYEYLIESKMHDLYVDYFLSGISFITNTFSDSFARVANESLVLAEGLQAMSSPSSVCAVLRWFSSDSYMDFYSSEKVFSKITEKAAELYLTGATELYDVMIQCCTNALRTYDHHRTRECMAFFEKTHTLNDATLFIINQSQEQPSFYFADMISYNPSVIHYIISAYTNMQYNNHEMFKKIIRSYASDDLYAQSIEIVLSRTGEEMPEREPCIDYHKMHQKGRQRFFNALFSKEELENLLFELTSTFGNPALLVKDLLDSEHKIEWYSHLKPLQISIYHSADKELQVREFFQKYSFDHFSIIKIKDQLQEKNDLTITSEQKAYLFERTAFWFNKQVLHHGTGNSISEFVWALIYISQYFDFNLPDEVFLDMTMIPSPFFYRENVKSKYDYLMSHLSIDALKTRIAHNLDLDLGDSLLSDHIDFCSKISYDVATTKALSICQNDSATSWLRSSALNYLYKLYGATYVSSEILPAATGNFLLELSDLCKDIPRVEMRNAMESEYEESPSLSLMSHLIALNSEIAIESYIEIIAERNSIPENATIPDGPTRAISAVDDPKLLPLLAKIMDIAFDPNFVDARHLGLTDSLINAMINCGKIAPDDTIAAIDTQIREKGHHIDLCNYMIEEIKRNRQKNSDQPLSLSEVISLIR